MRLRDLKTRERVLGYNGGRPIVVRWDARNGGEVELGARTVKLPDMDKAGFENLTRRQAMSIWRHVGNPPKGLPWRDDDGDEG